MNQKQKATIVQKIIETLATHNVSFAEVPEVLKELTNELDDLKHRQVIKIS